MKLIPDDAVDQPKRDIFPMRFRVILGAIILVIVATAIVFYILWKSSSVPAGGEGATARTASSTVKPNSATQQVSATGTVTQTSSTAAPVPTPSAADIQKRIDAMQQRVK